MNKKAQLGDMIFVLVTITSIALTMLIGAYVYNQAGTTLTNNEFATNESIDGYNAFAIAFPIFDNAMVFIVLALVVGLIVSSMFIPTSNIFLVINIIGILGLVFLGAVFANLYGEMLEHDGMDVIASENYPITSFILKKLPFFGAGLVLLLSIIMYSKRSEYG